MMSYRKSIGCFFFFWICLQATGFAQEPEKTLPESAKDTLTINGKFKNNFIEIDRLIVDETLSKAGYDFLELFQTKWTWPLTLKEPFLMIVSERPFRGISTQLVISLNDLVVFESFLQTRYDVLESLADAAVEQALAYLLNYESIMAQIDSEELIEGEIY